MYNKFFFKKKLDKKIVIAAGSNGWQLENNDVSGVVVG